MSDRGMKKWAPYKSLVEQDPHLISTIKQKHPKNKPLISNEEAESINEILTNYQGEKLRIKYYQNGETYETIKIIKKIDTITRKLIFSDRSSLSLDDIYSLKREN